jgi:hypothetical protein
MRNIRHIEMRVIPQSEQRYPTKGDYFFDSIGTLQIRTSDLGDIRMNMLVLLHEFWEVLRTEYDGVPEPEIKAFDESFESARSPGNIDEPGDSEAAPYSRQHCEATGVERIMAAALDVPWQKYTDKCNEN